MRKQVRLGVAIAAAAAALALMAPSAHATGGRDMGDGAPGPAQGIGSILDGWANRDMDIGTFISDFGRLDGWANRDVAISAFSSDFRIGCRVDGWANRDVDIGER